MRAADLPGTYAGNVRTKDSLLATQFRNNERFQNARSCHVHACSECASEATSKIDEECTDLCVHLQSMHNICSNTQTTRQH